LPDGYALFGHPVGHSPSPWVHARFAELTGQDMVYEARDVEPGRFAEALREFLAAGGLGLNITLPHKLDAYRSARRLTPRARRAGAVNTLAVQPEGLLGDNTDGAGLVRDLRVNLGQPLAGKRVLVLGAGGAARGAVAALLEEAPALVGIANRTASKARDLARIFADGVEVAGMGLSEASDPWDLVVNATSASLAGERPDLAGGAVAADTFCYDMVYGGMPTPFLEWAARRGAAGTADGTGMLVEQAAESFGLWRGVRPPTAPVLEELRARLAGD
jgi:shikimate dehydrogenase